VIADPDAAAAEARHRLGGAIRWLSLAVIAGAAGMAVAALRGEGSAMNTYLFMERALSHEAAGRIERSAALLVLLTALAGIGWARWPLLLPAIAYPLLEAIARLHVEGQAFSEWALYAHAPRYAAPAALCCLLVARGPGRSAPAGWLAAGEWLLRAACASVFLIHGLECLRANPAFIDLLISSAQNLLRLRLTESSARSALEVIGFADLAVAGALLIRMHPAVLAWAAAWATIAALARLTASGWGAFPDVLVRASAALAPLVLWHLRYRPRRSVSTSA
jgi:hypothetical protein